MQYCESHLYADDAQIYFSFQHANTSLAENLIKCDINALVQFVKLHFLQINLNKSSVIFFE